MPENTCYQMSQRIEMVVRHHLRFTTGTTCEIHQHRIFIYIHFLWTHKGRCFLPFSKPIVKTLCYRTILLCQSVDRNKDFHCRTLGHSLSNLRRHIFIIDTYNSFYRCTLIAINDITCCQHMSCRDCHSTYLAQRHHRNPPLIMAF